MATYKVIQDIEAEDKLLGPLSLRQFLYAVIVVVLGFVAFTLARANILLVIPFIPPMILFGILAAPFVGGQQPSETWLLAKIRYHLLPRKKVWNQSGVKELVKITAPKNIEPERTDGLDQTQVKSRLKALASTLDSRGWAIKNVEVSAVNQGVYSPNPSDRLLNPMGSTSMSVMDVHESDDVLDEAANPVAQSLQNLINASAKTRRSQIVQNMQQIQSNQQTGTQAQSPTPEELALSESIKKREQQGKLAYTNMKSISPKKTESTKSKNEAGQQKAQAVTTPVDPDILKLANNDDLNVATLARQLSKSSDREVVVSLH